MYTDEEKMQGQEIRQLLRGACEITIYTTRNQLYIGKNFRSKLQSAIDISVSKETPQELIIKETGSGKCKKSYFSKELVQQISDSVGKRSNMKFFFFYTKEENVWKGILILDFEDSYLWECLRKNEGVSGRKQEDVLEIDGYKEHIIRVLNRKYWGLVEYEELKELYYIAYRVSVSAFDYWGEKLWECIVICTVGLLRELSKAQRRAKKIESSLSLNKRSAGEGKSEFQELLGTVDYRFVNLEVDEFKSTLTELENWFLNMLLQEIDTVEISRWIKWKSLIDSLLENIKKKAFDYYGMDYIKSILIME